MNLSILLFFLHTTLATAVVGGTFLTRGGNVAKYFVYFAEQTRIDRVIYSIIIVEVVRSISFATDRIK